MYAILCEISAHYLLSNFWVAKIRTIALNGKECRKVLIVVLFKPFILLDKTWKTAITLWGSICIWFLFTEWFPFRDNFSGFKYSKNSMWGTLQNYSFLSLLCMTPVIGGKFSIPKKIFLETSFITFYFKNIFFIGCYIPGMNI